MTFISCILFRFLGYVLNGLKCLPVLAVITLMTVVKKRAQANLRNTNIEKRSLMVKNRRTSGVVRENPK
jgi:uncharacterized membrane protein (GlpM family)